MLKKLALVAVVALGSSAAFADRDVGCGIGSQVWAGQSGKQRHSAPPYRERRRVQASLSCGSIR